jgi:PH domain
MLFFFERDTSCAHQHIQNQSHHVAPSEYIGTRSMASSSTARTGETKEEHSAELVAKQGELTKQGHFVKSWKVRWFVLQGTYLFYFKSRKVCGAVLPCLVGCPPFFFFFAAMEVGVRSTLRDCSSQAGCFVFFFLVFFCLFWLLLLPAAALARTDALVLVCVCVCVCDV